MGGSRKSKMVTWASDVSLCQVRLFLSEDSPSRVGVETQDHLQAKALWPSPSGALGPDDSLPPGFGRIPPANPLAAKLSQIPVAKWRCPPRFQVNSAWQVVAGEESREMESQNHREMRVLEAIYPRPSTIPPNPSVLAGAEGSSKMDQFTPVVPITPIEDEDVATDAPLLSVEPNSNPMIPQPHYLPQGTFSSQISANVNQQPNGISAAGVEPSIVAAAQAALRSAMSRNDPGNLIDPSLLIKILSNPKMIEQLVTNQASASSVQPLPPSTTQNIPTSSFHRVPATSGQTAGSAGAQHMPPSSVQGMQSIRMQTPPSSSTTIIHNMPSTSAPYPPNPSPPPNGSFTPVNRRDPLSTHTTRPELGTPPGPTSTAPFHPSVQARPFPNLQPSTPDLIPAASPSATAPIAKDINYYKSLIQQHGAERQETTPQHTHQINHPSPSTIQQPQNFSKPKPRIMKPCIFFNSSRGCRNGANCTYQHDMSSHQRATNFPEIQRAKRMKFDREMTGA